MKFLSVIALASIASAGVVRRGSAAKDAAAIDPITALTASLQNTVPSVGNALGTAATTVNPAVTAAVGKITDATTKLDTNTHSNFNAIDSAVTKFQKNPNGGTQFVATIQATIQINLRNILEDVQDAVEGVSGAAATSVIGSIQSGKSIGQKSVDDLNDSILRVNKVLRRFNSSVTSVSKYLTTSVKSALQADVNSVQEAFRDLITPLSTLANAIVRFARGLNLTSLYAAADDLIKIVKQVLSLSLVPTNSNGNGNGNGNGKTNSGKGISLSVNLGLGGSKTAPTTTQ